MNKPILIAVAWPYAHGDLYVGHLAGAFLPADIVARYHRYRLYKKLDVAVIEGELRRLYDKEVT